MHIRIIKNIIAELLLITFIGTIATLLLAGYTAVILYFLVSLILSKNSKREKLVLLISASMLFVFFNAFLAPAYLLALHKITSSPDVSNHVSGYIVPVLKVYMIITEGQITNALTLSFYRTSLYATINPILKALFLLNIILPIIPFILRKAITQALPAFISFLFLSGWLAAPYMFSFYIHLYASTPILWSLDYPYVSFPYFIAIIFVLSISIGLSLLNVKKIGKMLILLLLG